MTGALLLAQVLTVAPSGPYSRLGDAVRAAPAGARIVVQAGRYEEPTVVVDRPVEIVGKGRPVLDGGGERTVLRVVADGVVIRGLVIRNTGWSGSEDRAGIRLEGVREVTIRDNVVEDTFFGIVGHRAHASVIAGNRVEGPGTRYPMTGNAIHCWSCQGVTIERNQARGHRDGVYLEFVRGSAVRNNRIERNLRYGLHFMFSDSSVYTGNTFHDNASGVAVMYTRRVLMAGNRFERSRGPAAYGLLLKEISDSRILDNEFRENTVGLYLENANRNLVEGNRFRRNGRALRLLANATGNEIRRNVFEGNSFDVTTNSTASSSRFHENYWDRYAGYDLDRDGYGDLPFRPVRLFGLLVEQNAPAVILLRSPFVDLLDAAERILPVLTPASLADRRPLMRPPRPRHPPMGTAGSQP